MDVNPITFLASYLIWIMVAGIFGMVLFVRGGSREVLMHGFFSAFGAWGIVQMIKTFLPVSRPFLISGEDALTVTVPMDSSFPSAHAAVAFAIATAVFLHERMYGAVFLIGALLVGVGRVMANVHFVQDVFAGAIIGVSVAFAMKNVHFKT